MSDLFSIIPVLLSIIITPVCCAAAFCKFEPVIKNIAPVTNMAEMAVPASIA